MDIRAIVLAAAGVLGACSPAEQSKTEAPRARAEAGDPTESVRTIYAVITSDAIAPQTVQQPYTDSLKTLWDAYDHANEEGLGFDPFVNGQDDDVANVAIALESPPHEGAAVVSATFVNFARQNELRFDMRLEDGQWRIDNIRSLADPTWNLRDMLSPS